MAHVNLIDPFDFIIFGATGDLTMRKLLPAFLRRFHAGEFTQDARIICIARSAHTPDKFRQQVRQALKEFAADTAKDTTLLDQFLSIVTYVALDATKPDSNWDELKDALKDQARTRVYYLATAPALYAPLCAALAEHKLITRATRVVLEKPIGVSLKTATQINDGVGRFFPEESIYRIDHYLGKEGVQNLLALRFANRHWKNCGVQMP